MKWAEEEIERQYAERWREYDRAMNEWHKAIATSKCVTAAMPSKPTRPELIIIGHSWGGDSGLDLANAFAAKGVHVDFLLTLDAVEDLFNSRFVLDSSGAMVDPDTYWANAYDMTVLDYVADSGRVVPYVGAPVTGLFAGVIATAGAGLSAIGIPTGLDFSDAVAVTGGRYGSESRANGNYENDGVHHGGASGYLQTIRDRDAFVRSRLWDSGILR
jgi:pimeloyl-ACP methyl ester carboxylesterase